MTGSVAGAGPGRRRRRSEGRRGVEGRVPPVSRVPPASHLPPVAEAAVASMALVITSGIYLAAHLPDKAPLGPAVGLLALAGALLLVEAGMLARLERFAWDVFFRVFCWALLAYVVIGGMLEYVFVLDQTRGSMLVLMTLSLVVFAVDIPLLFAFSVARYQTPAGRR